MKNSKDREIQCDVCGKQGARLRYVSRSYGKGDNLLIIEDIPVISCPHCGESYLSAETAIELDRIKENARNRAVKRQVSVAQFSEPSAA